MSKKDSFIGNSDLVFYPELREKQKNLNLLLTRSIGTV